MFLRRTRGLVDFLVAALLLWAAAYHTPVGALLRNVGAWVTGTRSASQPLLAYYSGGVYDVRKVDVPTAPPPPPMSLVQTELSQNEALGYGLYATWLSADSSKKDAGRKCALKLGADPARLDDPGTGPREATRLIALGSAEFGSEEAAVLAMFSGYEPARYAADRIRAEGTQPTLDEFARQLPPGFTDQLIMASQSMSLGTAYSLAWPVREGTPITSPFGWRDHPVLGRKQLHTGVDLGVPEGTEVRATGGGIVRRSSEDSVNGRIIVIDHGRGVMTAYCHNSELIAQVGDRIERGQIVSRSGNTGRSTGPHLHYQLELGHAPMDPLLFHGTAGTPSKTGIASANGFAIPKIAPPPTVEAQTVEAKKVELHGKDFPANLKLTAFVQGCEKETTHELISDKRGEVYAFLGTLPKSRCAFTCDVDSAPLTITVRGTEKEILSKSFPCWKPGGPAPKPLVAVAPKPPPEPKASDAMKDAFGKVAQAPEPAPDEAPEFGVHANATEY